MKMSMVGVCTAMALCLAVGTAQASPNPGAAKVGVKKSVKKAPSRQPVPVVSGTPTRLDPVRVAGIRKLANGKYELTTEWRPYTGVGNDAQDTLIFDAAQVDPSSGIPYGGAECGVPEGNRWLLNYNDDQTKFENPNTVTNMEVPDAFDGAASGRATFLYYWTTTNADFFVAFFTSEDVSFDCAAPAIDNVYDGIVYGFASAATGFYYTDADTEFDGLFYTMPADGVGGCQMVIADTFVDGVLTLTPGKAQPGLWGTANNGGIPGRPGISMDPKWDDGGADGRTADGEFDPDTECFTYAFGVCPDPLTTAVSFWGSEAGDDCYSDCDHNEVKDFFDFLCFLNAFDAEDPYADCEANEVFDFFDFLCFLNDFDIEC